MVSWHPSSQHGNANLGGKLEHRTAAGQLEVSWHTLQPSLAAV